MKTSILWQQYQEYTTIVSSICRKLGFAAAAIAWIFKAKDATFPPLILTSILFLIGYFLADIFQYLIAAFLLKIWTRRKEKELWNKHEVIDGDVEKPTWIDYPSEWLFYIKIIFLLITYGYIAVNLFKN